MNKKASALSGLTRRDVLKAVTAGIIGLGLSPAEVLAELAKLSPSTRSQTLDDHIKDYFLKMRDFTRHHKGDICLDRKEYRLLKSAVKRLYRVQRTVGHGNFHLLSFDDSIKIARNYSRVGAFLRDEINFLEKLFYEDAERYGFYGQKPLKNLTDGIRKKEVVKISYTGNYLYRGLPFETYKKIKRQLGDSVILTSGVRSVTKQFLLFLNKAYRNKGNLSLASRQLAPPGYSFHGIGDFDVGQVGFGAANFTDKFITTPVYRELKDLGYLTLRYPRDNMLGVRFEPWHIKVNLQA